jgi:hypothetical protein
MTRFLLERLSLAHAGAQTAACGDVTLPQQEKITRQVSSNKFPSILVSENHEKYTANGTVIDDAPLKNARALADFAVTKKKNQW